MGVMAALIAMMNLVPMVSAAESADITVTVTVQVLSITLNQSTAAFGIIKNATMVNSSVTVTNDGNWPIDLTLKQTKPTGWTAGTAIGPNVYVMAGRFNATDAIPGSGDVIPESTTVADGTKFAGGGRNIAANGNTPLRLYFNAPTSTTVKTQQTITVTVGTVAA